MLRIEKVERRPDDTLRVMTGDGGELLMRNFGDAPATVDEADVFRWRGAGGVYTEAEPESLAPDIDRRQFRIWMLTRKGKTIDDVKAVLSAAIADANQRELALIDLEDAKRFMRSHPMFDIGMARHLGFVDEAEIDAAFREAATL